MRKFSKRILSFLTLLLLVLLYLCFFGRQISPEENEFIALITLGYPVVLLSLLVVLVFWILKRSKWSLLIFLSLIITWTMQDDLIALSYSSPEKDDIRLSSYNCRLFGFYQFDRNTEVRDSIFIMLEEMDSDILCFQEFYHTDRAAGFQTKTIIQEKLGPYHEHVKFTHILKHQQNFGVVTLSRFPIIHKGFIPFENDFNNYCIFSDIKIPTGDTIRVFNAHLASIHFRAEDYEVAEGKTTELGEFISRSSEMLEKLKSANVRRAQQVEKILAEVKRTPYPVVFAGDFNAAPFSYSYHRIAQLLEDSYQDAGFGVGGTYNGPFPSLRIDHIFHSAEVDVHSYSIEKKKLSDHFPVTIGFQLDYD